MANKSRLIRVVLAVLGITCFATAAQAADSTPSSAIQCEGGMAPIQGFVDAKKRFAPPIVYPKSEETNWSEGMVTLEFTIATDGTVRDLAVIDALGSPKFAIVSARQVATWRYDPAMRNGIPVERYGYRVSITYRFSNLTPKQGVHATFERKYNRARELLREEKYREAVALMEEAFTLRLNLLEEATGSFVLALAHSSLKEFDRALYHIGHATINEAGYLEKTLKVPAFALEVQLEAQNGGYKSAICADRSLKKINPAGDPNANKIVARINAALDNPAPLAIPAKLATNPAAEGPARWSHSLLRSKFHFDQIQGDVKSFRLVCVGAVLEAAMDPEMEWTVPSDAGDCSLRVFGAPGTTFRLIEEW